MKENKYEIDYTNFDPEKEYKVKNDRVNQSHERILGHIKTSEGRKKYLEDNPDARAALGENIKKWNKENPEQKKKYASMGGKSAMNGPNAHKIHSMGGKVSGPNQIQRLLKHNIDTGHYDLLHSKEIRDKIHQTKLANGAYKKWSDMGNEVLKAKHLKIYHERVAEILPILPDVWFSRKEAENIYAASDVRKKINAPVGIIKRIITELEFVESNGKTLKARRYKKI